MERLQTQAGRRHFIFFWPNSSFIVRDNMSVLFCCEAPEKRLDYRRWRNVTWTSVTAWSWDWSFGWTVSLIKPPPTWTNVAAFRGPSASSAPREVNEPRRSSAADWLQLSAPSLTHKGLHTGHERNVDLSDCCILVSWRHRPVRYCGPQLSRVVTLCDSGQNRRICCETLQCVIDLTGRLVQILLPCRAETTTSPGWTSSSESAQSQIPQPCFPKLEAKLFLFCVSVCHCHVSVVLKSQRVWVVFHPSARVSPIFTEVKARFDRETELLWGGTMRKMPTHLTIKRQILWACALLKDNSAKTYLCKNGKAGNLTAFCSKDKGNVDLCVNF